MSNEQLDQVRPKSYLDEQALRFDDPELKTTRERLRAGGEYQTGDVIPMFDEDGKQRFVRLDQQDDADWHVTMTGVGFERPVFLKETSQTIQSTDQLDRFTRGIRGDITALVHQLRYETHQMTISMPVPDKDVLEEAMRTGDFSRLPRPVTLDIFEGLATGVKEFYYQEPSQYQTLLDISLRFTQLNKQRAEHRAGIQLADLRTTVELEQALRQVLGQEGIPVVGESRISGAVLHKYASRMQTGLRLAMATLECWYQEQGHNQLQRTTLSE